MTKEKPINIVAISEGLYPKSVATNIRHLAILRGLQENGANVCLLSLYVENLNAQKRNIYFEVEIENLVIYRTKHARFIIKALFYLIGILKGTLRLIQNKSKKKLDVVIFYSKKSWILMPLILVCKLLRVKTLHERTEFPFLRKSNNLINFFKKWIYLRITIPCFDVLIVISTDLVKYFSTYFKKKILLFPIVVEPDRFKQVTDTRYNFPYIAYCGDLSIYKDGLDILIDSFARIANKYKKHNLVLIGEIDNSPDREMIHNKIILNKLTDRVILTGLIPFNEMPAYLKNADALLLSRPDNIQARFGMPTKLGEYLISGKPVILTSVGDITIYLKDGESAFITTPGDYNAFAEKIDYVLGNYENAIEVGLNGKKVCEEHFNYKIQSSVLLRELYRLLA